MSFERLAALYVFCADFHSGQSSRLYRLLSRIDRQYRLRLSDRAWAGIRRGKDDRSGEWETARRMYRGLKRWHAAAANSKG